MMPLDPYIFQYISPQQEPSVINTQCSYQDEEVSKDTVLLLSLQTLFLFHPLAQ